jgi:tellurite resistance protein TerC
LIELSLSADNLFIFYLIFRYFRLKEAAPYRVLFWGVVGAIRCGRH